VLGALSSDIGEKKRHLDGDREDNRDERLLKLVSAVIVKTRSKYRTRTDVDAFKKHVKEASGVHQILALARLHNHIVVTQTRQHRHSLHYRHYQHRRSKERKEATRKWRWRWR